MVDLPAPFGPRKLRSPARLLTKDEMVSSSLSPLAVRPCLNHHFPPDSLAWLRRTPRPTRYQAIARRRCRVGARLAPAHGVRGAAACRRQVRGGRRRSRTLLRRMTEPMPLPAARAAAGVRRGIVACLTVAAGTVLLGVVAGFLWAVVAPRPLLVMTGHGTAAVNSAETSPFIAADGWYQPLLAGDCSRVVRVSARGPQLRPGGHDHGPGQRAGRRPDHALDRRAHGAWPAYPLLATLVGAKLRAAVTLGARSAIVLAAGAGLMAGGVDSPAHWCVTGESLASGSALAPGMTVGPCPCFWSRDCRADLSPGRCMSPGRRCMSPGPGLE